MVPTTVPASRFLASIGGVSAVPGSKSMPLIGAPRAAVLARKSTPLIGTPRVVVLGSKSISRAPVAMMSPTTPCRAVTLPLNGTGTSTTALAVSTDTMGWSTCT